MKWINLRFCLSVSLSSEFLNSYSPMKFVGSVHSSRKQNFSSEIKSEVVHIRRSFTPMFIPFLHITQINCSAFVFFQNTSKTVIKSSFWKVEAQSFSFFSPLTNFKEKVLESENSFIFLVKTCKPAKYHSQNSHNIMQSEVVALCFFNVCSTTVRRSLLFSH